MSRATIKYLLVIALVVASYIAFLLPHLPRHPFSKAPQTQYQYLAQGFLTGHLHLSIEPSQQLLHLPNPYDAMQNQELRLHDTALYNSHYYLYFGPLPVVTFFIPFKLITGYYPPESLAVLIFMIIGFIFNFVLLIKIKKKYFNPLPEWQLLFAGLLLGLANNASFLFLSPRFYEAAIASAFCFMSAAMLFLYNIFDNDFRVKDVILFSVLLSLSVAGRPNFSVVCALLAVIMTVCFYRLTARQNLKKLLLSLWLPVISIGLLLGFYNYLRFHSFFEFGSQYQLGICTITQCPLITQYFYLNIPLHFYYYLIQPFFIRNFHPVPVWMQPYTLGTVYEFTVGILSTAPCVIYMALLPKFCQLNAKYNAQKKNYLLLFLGALAIIPIVSFISLIVINFTAQRYEIDFYPYLLFGAILCYWLVLQEKTLSNSMRKIAQAYFILTGLISIVIAVLIGVVPYGGAAHYFMLMKIFACLTGILFFLLPLTISLTYIVYRSLGTSVMLSARNQPQ